MGWTAEELYLDRRQGQVSSPNVRTASGADPNSYSVYAGGTVPVVKRTEEKQTARHPSSAEV